MNKRQTLIVNSSYNHETKVSGIGIIIHETDYPGGSKNGIVIDQLSEAYTGIPAGIGEMLALYRALQISVQRQYKVIKLRSDFNQMRKALKKSYEANSGFERGGLYGAIMTLTKEFESVKFGYNPRRKNQMARRLSRTGSKDMVAIEDLMLINICKNN